MNEGIQSLLTGPIVDSTSALSSLHASQVSLSLQLDQLSNTLAQYKAESEPFDMAPTLRKLKETRRRLEKVRDMTKVIEGRLLGVKKEIIQKGINTRDQHADDALR